MLDMAVKGSLDHLAAAEATSPGAAVLLATRTDFIAPGSAILSPEQVQELIYAFHRLDVSGTGRITAVELGAVLRRLGEEATQEELEQMVLEFDTDGDGCICLNEFIRLNELAAQLEVGGGGGAEGGGGGILEEVFRTFDRDADGFICPEELQMIFQKLGEEGVTLADCARMIQGADQDGDGQVDFREFEALMFAPSPPVSPAGSSNGRSSGSDSGSSLP